MLLLNFRLKTWCLLMAAALPFRLSAGNAAVPDADFRALTADRAAIERVYYLHRDGAKPPFDQILPPGRIQELVKRDLDKQAALKTIYGVEISDADIAAEAERINHATRAPDILADLKRALGNDPVRFGRTVVKPILVEKRLRELFQHDDAIHAAGREQAEQLRSRLIAAGQDHAGPDRLLELLRTGGEVTETTWSLDTPRPGPHPAPVRSTAHSANYSVIATTQWAQPKGAPTAFLADLPPELQALLPAQLRQPGDVSAVVETDSAFLIFLARERTDRILRAATVRIPREDYESWLSRQTGP